MQIQAARVVGRITPGERDACTGKVLERDTPGRRGGALPRAHGHRGRGVAVQLMLSSFIS